MAYCHECGEEVAEIDVFCPHCGISLQPVEISNESDVAQENTIAISQSDIQETIGKVETGNTAVSPAKEEIISQLVEQDEVLPENKEISQEATENISEKTVEEIDMKTDGFSNPLTDENINLNKKTVEIPAEPEMFAEQTESELPDIENPSILENKTEKSEEVAEIPTDDSNSESEEVSEIETSSDSELTSGIAEDLDITLNENVSADLTSQSKSSFISDQDDYFADSYADTGDIEDKEESIESAFDDFVSDKVPEIEKDEIVDVAEESEAVVELKDSTDNSEAIETELASEIKSSEEPDKSDIEQSKIDLDEDIEKDLEPAISKPDFEFEPEETPEISQFDSVRIMESKEESVEESLDETLVNTTPVQSAKPIEPDVIDSKPVISQSSSEEDLRESRSYTTPNIGSPDTDGKQSKLKPLDEGTVLNSRYEIVRKIGGGGMGAVYLASDKNLGGVLRAVKEMVQSYIEETQQDKAINDFKRESMLLTSLEHAAIPTIFDYFYDDKEARFYLVMKYINGGDLSSRLRSAPEGRIDEKTVVEWAIQVADVLNYLHQRQPPIVYRDLKPANIMIDGNTGRIMLIDFGIARWINKEEKGVTAVGTMGYAPPELFSGNVEPRSDIYSLGSTMFHLLTGADPQSNPLLIFDFQKNPRPRQINPQLSDQIERILMRTVEYNAEKRFSSAAELRDELEKHLDNLTGNQITYGIKESPKAVTLSDEKVFCGFCGQSIVASDLFCAFCGAKQPIAQKGVHGESYSVTPVTANLRILGTNDLESPSYPIEKDENLVGRRDPMSNIFPEVDLSKYDPQTKISRRHARIWRDGNKFMVEDLGSSNGTILMPVVNDAFRLVPNQPHILTNGDKLKLGDTTLHFVIG